jgi:hypothetical protein
MSQYNTGFKAFIANEAITRHLAVKLTTSTGDYVSVCGSNEANIGFADETVASGEYVTVKLKNMGGTFKSTASAAVSAGGALYNQASGKVSSVSGGTQRYVALEAADADGDIIEVLPVAMY